MLNAGCTCCEDCETAFNADANGAENILSTFTTKVTPSLHPIWVGITVPAGWHSQESSFMTSPTDSNRNKRWETANRNIPIQRYAVGFFGLQVEKNGN